MQTGFVTISIDPAIKNNGYCIFYTSNNNKNTISLSESYAKIIANAAAATALDLAKYAMFNAAFAHINLIDAGTFSVSKNQTTGEEIKVTTALQVADGTKSQIDALISRASDIAKKLGTSDLRVLIEIPHRKNFKLVKIYSNMAFYIKSVLKLPVTEIHAGIKSKFMKVLPFSDAEMTECKAPSTAYLKRKVQSVCAMQLIVRNMLAVRPTFIATIECKKLLTESKKTSLRDISDAFIQYLTTAKKQISMQ